MIFKSHKNQNSGADNSNNSSNPDTSMKFGKKHPYMTLSKINHEPLEIFKMAAIFKMEAKNNFLHLSLGCMANRTPSKIIMLNANKSILIYF